MNIEQRHQGGRGRGTEQLAESDDDASACALARDEMSSRRLQHAEKGGAFTAIRHLKRRRRRRRNSCIIICIYVRRRGRRTIPLALCCRALLSREKRRL